MLLNVATVFEMVIVTGFITFVPKYIETQFDTKTSQANLYTGWRIYLYHIFDNLEQHLLCFVFEQTQNKI